MAEEQQRPSGEISVQAATPDDCRTALLERFIVTSAELKPAPEPRHLNAMLRAGLGLVFLFEGADWRRASEAGPAGAWRADPIVSIEQ